MMNIPFCLMALLFFISPNVALNGIIKSTTQKSISLRVDRDTQFNKKLRAIVEASRNGRFSLPDELYAMRKSIVQIDLSMIPLKAQHLKTLVRLFPNIRSLNLANTHLLCEHITYLRGLHDLTSLNLDNNSMGTAGVEALANSKNLKNLTDLSFAGVLGYSCRYTGLHRGTEGAKILVNSKNLENLRSLNLSRNFIGNDGAKALANSKYMKNLRDLDLGAYNLIGDKGAKAIANSMNLGNLRSLNLRDSYISNEGVKVLINSVHLNNLTRLDLLYRDPSIKTKDKKALKKLARARKLRLRL